MAQLALFYLLESDLLDLQAMAVPGILILLCVLVSVFVIRVLCTEKESSTNQLLKQEQDQTVKVPRPNQANPPLVDLTYVEQQAPRTGIMKKIIVDLNDAAGLKLRDLWPLSSYQMKSVLVGNTVRVGLELPEGTLENYRLSGTRHPEVQRHGHTGIWVSAIIHTNTFNVTTRGFPVETQPIMAYTLTTIGTGTGQTMKSFIRK